MTNEFPQKPEVQTGSIEHQDSAIVLNTPQPIKTQEFSLAAGTVDPDEIERDAEKYMAVETKLRSIAVKCTNKNDWVDQNGRPYLQWSGAARIARAFGVSYQGLKYTEALKEDEHGPFLIIECTGTIIWRGSTLEEIGTGSSRDPFFGVRTRYIDGKKEKYFLPLSEVDITNIKKKAQTNFLNRALKSMVGLSFTWDEVNDALKNRGGNVTKIEYDKSKSQTRTPPASSPSKPDTSDKSKKEEIWTMLEEMHGTSAGVSLKALTSFKGRDGKQVPGKAKITYVSPAQVDNIYPKVKEQYDEFKKRVTNQESHDADEPEFTKGANVGGDHD